MRINSIDTREMTYEEWKESRRVGLGGSDIAALLGMSKYKTPLQLYLEKIGEYDPPPAGEAAYWGTQLEEIVAREFTKQTQKKVRNVNRILIHPEHEFLIANIDRKVVGEKAILECKTTGAWNYKDWEGDEIPQAYILQVMHYMAVTETEKAYFACLIGGQKFQWKEIERDEELISLVTERCVDFWKNHVEKRIPPAVSAEDGELLKRMYPQAVDTEAIALPSEVDTAITKIQSISAQLKELEALKEEQENRIKQLLGEHESGYTGSYIVNWGNVNSNRLDTTKLKKELPEIAQKYSKLSSYRKFAIKEVKTA